MKRKLIKQGGGGLTFYVPKKWTDKQNLKAGDELNIQESDNELHISAQDKTKQLKELTVKIAKENKNRIRTIISSAYRRGYDQIYLVTEHDMSLVEINHIVDTLLGFVVTEQTEKRIVIKNIMADNFEDTDAIINKLFITIKFFMQAVIDYIESGGKDSELIELSKSIIKLRDYSQRMIHITEHGDDRSYEYHTLVFVAEKLAGNFKQLIRNKPKNKKDCLKELDLVYDYFSTLFEAYLKRKIESVININKELNKKTKENDCVMLENLFSISSRLISILI